MIAPTAYRSPLPVSRTGFGPLLRSEWTKLRTVRGWIIGLSIGGLLTVLVGLISALGSQRTCATPSGSHACPSQSGPVDAAGAAVTDSFAFDHRTLVGDGSLTVRVTSLRSAPLPPGQAGPAAGSRPILPSWAKAGLIVKASLRQGSAYAAIMVTGGHGVRMQSGYTRDLAGPAGAVSPTAPRWLRLARTGDRLTGSTSSDGAHWSRVGVVRLAALPAAVPVGLFVASPDYTKTDAHVGGFSSIGSTTRATATFDHAAVHGRAGAAWQSGHVGDDGPPARISRAGGTFTVSGSGDIAPATAGPDGNTVERSLVGAVIGLIALVVVGAMYGASEYRRGLVRISFAANPRRGRVLTAKTVVLGVSTFVVGLVASALGVWIVGAVRRRHGMPILPVSSGTQTRVIVGTALLLTAAAVLGLALATALRRSAGAVTAVIALVVLPYLLAVASVLPAGAAMWLLRITPAAGFAIQQSIPAYHQVAAAYIPASGYFPLPPWAGFGVLGGWTAAALVVAAVLLRRRDA